MKIPTVGEMRKFIAALSGAAAQAVSLGLLHGSAERWVTGALAVVTTFLVYRVPNDRLPNDPQPQPQTREEGATP